MYESMHNHTVISDGLQTHLEVLESAHEAGFKVIAFTDHDVFPDDAVIRQLRDYDGPVTWTVGVELSCGLPTDLGGTSQGNLHILGYFCDPQNSALKDYLEQLRSSRLVRLERQVAHIQSLGFELSVADCLMVAGIGVPVSHHVVTALKLKPANLSRIEELRIEFEEAAKMDLDLAHNYVVMMDRGPVQYPYALFMKSSSFKPMPEDTLGSSMVDFDGAVQLIHGAGGIAVLAHWYFHEDKFPRTSLAAVIKDGRIDGVETAVYNRQIGTADYSAQNRYLTELAERLGCATVIGIDGHYPDDFQVFLGSGLADQTIGQFKALVDRFQPALIIGNL
jgi:predicted metal-dependent phosphoesterase TrpH